MTSARSQPEFIGVLARAVVAGVLIYAGATKAAGPVEEFALIVNSYGILPREAVLSAAAFLPWAEMALGWMLLLGVALRAAAAASGLLFACFLCALVSTQLRGIVLPNCGCFGDTIHLTMFQALAFDSILLALSWLAWRVPARLSLDSWIQRGYTVNAPKRP